MKLRRRIGAGAAGVLALVLAAQTTTGNAREATPVPPAPTSARVVALSTSEAVLLDLPVVAPPSTTTTTAPPPPTAYCPVAGPVSFVDSFGAPRRGHRHQGVDMMAAMGTPLVAPVAGVVTRRDNRTGGLSYHLTGDDGAYYYGTHLSAYEGDDGWVSAGTVIGYVGDSGNARGGSPHLHFEIHPGGESSSAVDPYDTVSLLCVEVRTEG